MREWTKHGNVLFFYTLKKTSDEKLTSLMMDGRKKKKGTNFLNSSPNPNPYETTYLFHIFVYIY